MKFFYINIFLLFVSLGHFISLYKDYNKKYIYTNEIYNNFFNLKIKRSLAQHARKKSLKRIVTRNSLTNETISNDKLLDRNDVIDNSYNGLQMDENSQDNEKNNYGLNEKLKNEYEKYILKNSSSKSFDCMTRLKNWLYRKIYKERSFWVHLSMFTGVLGAGAAASLFNMLCILICSLGTGISLTFIGAFGTIWAVLVGIIILIILGTWMLVTWLWPHKDVYNETCGI
ncbi:exported protein (hyp15) [Plasmodium gaboni]|uniref:Exported protein (Hyp15) n=1 Tax=Plasmodium gaboni TaxID=647221 RepID=A0A151L2D6_9APIC|nr:exported protein (hyp15) [Plasmodium gaboni]KYN93122.1 exported protein (hyp15) [Plasmodium gaboni]